MDRLLPDRVRLGQQLCLEPTALAGAASSTQTGSAIGAVCLNPILAGMVRRWLARGAEHR